MPALQGNIRDFGIGEVFQLIGQQRKTGLLSVEGTEGRIEVFFETVAASCRPRSPGLTPKPPSATCWCARA